MSIREVKGTVFDIQHYSIHDGPGIRVNVFLKGCPLRCLWCQNPESNSAEPQLMYYSHKCVGCGLCAKACPHGCIAMQNGRPVTRGCTVCGSCVEACPQAAREISGRQMSAGEVIDEVAKDRLFMGADGGITVTGGEPLMHADFTAALLALAKDQGINTAIETSGYATWEIAEPVFALTDYVLFDVKHMQSERHVQCTGVPNELILSNLKRLNDEQHSVIHVRTPIVPGYNDSDENMELMGRYISENITRCQRVSLLPYHPMGESKREQLCAETKSFRAERPSVEHMERLRGILRKYGLQVD